MLFTVLYIFTEAEFLKRQNEKYHSTLCNFRVNIEYYTETKKNRQYVRKIILPHEQPFYTPNISQILSNTFQLGQKN